MFVNVAFPASVDALVPAAAAAAAAVTPVPGCMWGERENAWPPLSRRSRSMYWLELEFAFAACTNEAREAADSVLEDTQTGEQNKR